MLDQASAAEVESGMGTVVVTYTGSLPKTATALTPFNPQRMALISNWHEICHSQVTILASLSDWGAQRMA
jgi:hypothetical protein